jgi:hexosaminidase
VEVEVADDTLDQTTNYSYSLNYWAPNYDGSGGTTVMASAASPFGLGYALETLLQLASPKGQLDCGGSFTVVDRPVYKHRGLLLDTARRFFPLALLESTIDAMSIFKLNVLHLHLNDGNSVHRFRVESKTFPQLTQPQNCSTCGFYTQDEIKSLVSYAHMRGVRIIPEFELLSHATSICGPLKDEGIVCCSGKWGMLQLGDDPAGNTTRILNDLLTEMIPLFPDSVVHIGGDETQYETTGPCTINASKSLQQKIMTHLVALGKTPMGWQEILLETGAAASFPAAIIEPWSKAGLWAQTGHPAVEALPSSLYLDTPVTSAGYVHGSYRPGVWFDITSGALNESNAHFLLGGEASMWADQYLGNKHTPGHLPATCMLPSPSGDANFSKAVSGTIWPRAAVAAGSFWRWEESLSPHTQPELFASVVAAVNEILMARGVETCPCANATFNGCDSVARCGVAWCNKTAA